ncbi:MAG: tyrosinase family protein [Mesorhizobium sp.]|nr:MAG: tyrosinase family protein [Mesorhizobium sp.]
MNILRRDLLVGGGALCLASQVKVFAQTAAPLRERVYADKAPASLTSYKRAVDAMLALDAKDGRNWFRQALIHVLDCPHDNWWFLPWHRGYLLNFENICRELSGDDAFRLPYWDWTESPSVPLAFFDDELNPGNARFTEGYVRFREGAEDMLKSWWTGLTTEQLSQLSVRPTPLTDVDSILAELDSHFYSGNGARDPSKDAPDLADDAKANVKLAYIEGALSVGKFDQFSSYKTNTHHDQGHQGTLESGPHGMVHYRTGGFMGAFLSPVDPIFWLHHANLDRLWDVWTRKQANANSAILPDKADIDAFKNEPFLFFHGKDGAPLAKRCGDSLDLNGLGYAYEPGSAESVAAAPVAPPANLTNVLFALNVGADLRSGFEASGAITGLSEALSVVGDDSSSELFTRITLTPPSDAKDVSVRVYINCPYLSKFTPVDDPHYVGTISFFSAMHRSQHHSNEVTVLLPLGVALKALGEQKELPRSAIKVQLIPIAENPSQTVDGMLQSVTVEVL